jgi:hypothetical protein
MSREEKIICRWNREFPVKSCARLFTCTRDRKVEKNFPREFSFPPSNILFFPGHYFSAGHGKGNLEPGKFYFHDTKMFCYLLRQKACRCSREHSVQKVL